jgi:hypothetical protein
MGRTRPGPTRQPPSRRPLVRRTAVRFGYRDLVVASSRHLCPPLALRLALWRRPPARGRLRTRVHASLEGSRRSHASRGLSHQQNVGWVYNSSIPSRTNVIWPRRDSESARCRAGYESLGSTDIWVSRVERRDLGQNTLPPHLRLVDADARHCPLLGRGPRRQAARLHHGSKLIVSKLVVLDAGGVQVGCTPVHSVAGCG